LSSYSLSTGGSVSVRFTNGITVANPTLNLNSQGAKDIYYMGAALTDTELIEAGDIVTFVYSTQYHIVNILKNKKYVPVDEYEADAVVIAESFNDLNRRLADLQVNGSNNSLFADSVTFQSEAVFNNDVHLSSSADEDLGGIIYFGDKSSVWIGEVEPNHEAFLGENYSNWGGDDVLSIFAMGGTCIYSNTSIEGDLILAESGR
jgi:hypothetical protein